jgi:Ca2+-binding RTX toxin-like protein
MIAADTSADSLPKGRAALGGPVKVRDLVFEHGPELTAVGSDGFDDLSVSYSDGYYEMKAAGGIETDSCSEESATKVRCFDYGSTPPTPTITMQHGRDRVVLKTRRVKALVLGKQGSDTLIGSGARNDLRGGDGNDTVDGHGGNDPISGDKGKDSLFGGAGDDHLYALDDDSDAKISCGPGTDIAFVDRKLDRKPSGCEKIRYTYPPPPK